MRDGEDPRTWFNPDAVVRSERVEIDAPAALIWEILTDLPRYGEWNPFCIAAESTLEMGAPVHMTLKSYTEPDATFPNCEYVCAFGPEKLLSWQLPYDDAWPYPARRDQIIEALGAAFNKDFVACHTVHHPIIDVHGDGTADGEWRLVDYALNLKENNLTTIGAATYRDKYVLEGDAWKIRRATYTRIYERVFNDPDPALTFHILGGAAA